MVVVIDFVCPNRNVQFKQNEFHFHHIGKDLSRPRPVMSDVSHCVRVTLILIKAVLSKCRKVEISLQSFKDLFQNNNCTELTSDERTSPDHSGTHLTSLAEFGSSSFQDRGIEINFIQINVSFRTNKIDNN